MLSANIHVSLVLCLFTSLKITAATVYLRNPNERGPTAGTYAIPFDLIVCC